MFVQLRKPFSEGPDIPSFVKIGPEPSVEMLKMWQINNERTTTMDEVDWSSSLETFFHRRCENQIFTKCILFIKYTLLFTTNIKVVNFKITNN